MPKNSNPLAKKSGPSTNMILTILVALVAVLVVGGVLLFSGSGNDNSNANGSRVPAEVLTNPSSHTLSESPDGKVTVVEFLDYQCPMCKKYYDSITKQIEQEYQGRITFVPRNFPLDGHPLAMLAARASEAAALQGKYEEMYHGIYDEWQSWAVAPDGKQTSSDEQKARAVFDGIAQRNGLDLEKFHQDMASPQVQQQIDRDLADGEKAGISGTPTIFVNGQKWEPSNVQTFDEAADQLRQRLDEELAR